MKIKEISHLLDEYQVETVLKKDDGKKLKLIILPKLLDEKVDEADRVVLQNPFVLRGTAEELDMDAPGKLIEWVSKLKEGKDNLDIIQKELDKAAAEKKKKASPPKKEKKKAPPRKTAAQKKVEARESQEKAMTGQGNLFDGNRMESKEPLKTAVEKAEEKSLEDDVADLGI